MDNIQYMKIYENHIPIIVPVLTMTEFPTGLISSVGQILWKQAISPTCFATL